MQKCAVCRTVRNARGRYPVFRLPFCKQYAAFQPEKRHSARFYTVFAHQRLYFRCGNRLGFGKRPCRKLRYATGINGVEYIVQKVPCRGAGTPGGRDPENALQRRNALRRFCAVYSVRLHRLYIRYRAVDIGKRFLNIAHIPPLRTVYKRFAGEIAPACFHCVGKYAPGGDGGIYLVYCVPFCRIHDPVLRQPENGGEFVYGIPGAVAEASVHRRVGNDR